MSEETEKRPFNEAEAKALYQALPLQPPPPPKRPNGGLLMGAGICLMLAGAVAFAIGLLVPEVTRPDSVGVLLGERPIVNSWKWPVLWLGVAALNLGLLLWALGLIVRALFFLPGREVTDAEFWGPGTAARS